MRLFEQKHLRATLICLLLACATPFEIAAAQEPAPHPLAIHMHHWLQGSGEWRTPNPDYDPNAAPRTAGWIKEYSVIWRWAEFDQHLVGELSGITPAGERIKFWHMFHFYNPATKEVIFQQVGRGGAFIAGTERLRTKPTPYGAPDTLDTDMFLPSGDHKKTRHETIFVDADTQRSDAFEQDDNGEWKLTRQWVWTRSNS